MPWTVEWSRTQDAKAHKANGTPHVFEAESRDAALDFAKAQVDTGRIVWCVKDEHGSVAMDRAAVWAHLHPPGKPLGSDLEDDWYLPIDQRSPVLRQPPIEQKPSPLERVMRLFGKR